MRYRKHVPSGRARRVPDCACTVMPFDCTESDVLRARALAYPVPGHLEVQGDLQDRGRAA